MPDTVRLAQDWTSINYLNSEASYQSKDLNALYEIMSVRSMIIKCYNKASHGGASMIALDTVTVRLQGIFRKLSPRR